VHTTLALVEPRAGMLGGHWFRTTCDLAEAAAQRDMPVVVVVLVLQP
jgi:hypothetical protein